MNQVAVAGALLAGGRSTRFGSDKLQARLPTRSERLIESSAAALRESGCAPLAWLSARAPSVDSSGFEHLSDPAEGPLGAVALALEWAESKQASYLVAVAGDLPLLRAHHLAYLRVAAARTHGGQLVCALGANGHAEPLCAAYPVAWAARARRLYASGERAVRALWQSPPRLVDLSMAPGSPSHSASEYAAEVTVSVTVPSDGRVTIHPCFNLNDQEDWEQLQKWSKEGELP